MREKYHWSEFDDLCELTRRVGVSKNVFIGVFKIEEFGIRHHKLRVNHSQICTHNFKQECIPVGCRYEMSVAGGVLCHFLSSLMFFPGGV